METGQHSCGSRLLTVNDSLPFGCVNLLSLSSPRPVHTLTVCFSHHLGSLLDRWSRVTVYRKLGSFLCSVKLDGLPQGPVSNALGFPPLVKRISSCQELGNERPSIYCVMNSIPITITPHSLITYLCLDTMYLII